GAAGPAAPAVAAREAAAAMAATATTATSATLVAGAGTAAVIAPDGDSRGDGCARVCRSDDGDGCLVAVAGAGVGDAHRRLLRSHVGREPAAQAQLQGLGHGLVAAADQLLGDLALPVE